MKNLPRGLRRGSNIIRFCAEQTQIQWLESSEERRQTIHGQGMRHPGGFTIDELYSIARFAGVSVEDLIGKNEPSLRND